MSRRRVSLTVQCILDLPSVTHDKQAEANSLIQLCGLSQPDLRTDVVLHNWDLTRSDGDINKEMNSFDNLISREIPLFEQRLQNAITEMKKETEKLQEGEVTTVTLNKYERNPKARAACLAYHGTTCAVCGMDFGKIYGPEFAGRIEVHH